MSPVRTRRRALEDIGYIWRNSLVVTRNCEAKALPWAVQISHRVRALKAERTFNVHLVVWLHLSA